MRNELRNRIFLTVCLAGAFVVAACSDKKGGSASSSSTPNPMEAVLGSWTLDVNHADHSERIKRNFGGVTLTKSTITLKSGDGFKETEGYSNPSVHGSAMTIRVKGGVIALMPHGDRMTMVLNEEAINLVRDAPKPAAAPTSNTSMTSGGRGKRARTKEAMFNLRKIFDGSIAYYQKDQSARGQAQLIDKQFPVSVETPADWYEKVCPVPNKPARKYIPDGETWTADTWQRLDFAVSDPFYYKYIYESEGVGTEAQFTARAIGDLDCDGVFSTFERIGTVNEENEVEGEAALYTNKELE